MPITYAFTGVPVADYETALAWYERLIGRPPDVTPTEGEAMWELTERGWMYLVRDADRSGKGLLTLLVDELRAHLAELRERGLAPGPIDTVPGAVRRAAITDPEGNRITFGEDLSGHDRPGPDYARAAKA